MCLWLIVVIVMSKVAQLANGVFEAKVVDKGLLEDEVCLAKLEESVMWRDKNGQECVPIDTSVPPAVNCDPTCVRGQSELLKACTGSAYETNGAIDLKGLQRVLDTCTTYLGDLKKAQATGPPQLGFVPFSLLLLAVLAGV
eukprot:gnl/TRDRNA2_/TRDRNA2_166246_c0_seq2.p1 gnl/TRDRNA2_/TRDRNA2_166246_c0~~gnl/TRDRNA2_/TRDRNA2_166246_c0_seq2.p1  ORF type:complete len:141 (+),score=15.52 gnl/TRDRNA2_/TRDRNA2_166246_c0_seq2:144-566(+)